MLDSKLTGTDCSVECLLRYNAELEGDPVPHGWIPAAVEVSWPPNGDWRHSQAMVIETMLSSIEEFNRLTETSNPPCAASIIAPSAHRLLSSWLRLRLLGNHIYRCGDCDMNWTMIDPVI